MSLAAQSPALTEALFLQHAGDQRNRAASGPEWLSALHQKGYERFETLGIPTRHQEAWKYIDLKPVLGTPFQPVAAVPTKEVAPDVLQQTDLSDHAHRLVFVNGQLHLKYSTLGSLGNCKLLPLAQAIAEIPEVLQKHLGVGLESESDAFVALNTAFFHDGWVLYVPKNEVLIDPVHVLYYTTNGDKHPQAAYVRALVVLEENAHATVTTEFIGLDHHLYLNAPVTEVVAQRHSHLNLSMIQSESATGFHLGATLIRQQADSDVNMACIAYGGKTARHNIDVKFLGEHATCRMNGLAVLTGQTQVYRHIEVAHALPNCHSEQLFKGIISGEARSEFDGTILVGREASGTDALQLNKNLLLSGQARVYTRPQLQIDNDDVKCAHGATVGQLEEEELFYLLSRGINQETAQSLLTFGFAEEVIERVVSEPLRNRLTQQLLAALQHPQAAR